MTVTVSGGSGISRSIHCSTDAGSTWTTTAGDSAEVTVSAEGSHRFQYYASDSLTTEATHAPGFVNIDKTPPVTTDDHLVASLMAPATIVLSATDALSGMSGGLARTEYKVDDAGEYRSGSAVVLSHGTHTVSYRSIDAAGNREADRSFTVLVDSPPPVSETTYSFAAAATTGWHNLAQTVVVSAAGGGGAQRAIHYSTDGGATWTDILGDSAAVVIAQEGSHSFKYYASDSLATESVHDAGYVNVDVTPPAVSSRPVLASTPTSGWLRTDQTVVLTASDAKSGAESISYSIDGGPSTVYAGPLTVSEAGSHTVTYSATDRAGNAGAPEIGFVNIDGTRPSTAATAVSVKAGRVATLRFRITDALPSCGKAVVKIQIRKHTKVVKTITVGTRISNVAQISRYKAVIKKGTYNWRVLATDLAGNVASKVPAARLTVN